MASDFGDEKIDIPSMPQRRYSDGRRYSAGRRYSEARRSSVAQSDRLDFFDVTRKSGMPALYAISILTGIGGIICMGIITEEWANKKNPTCFLYSQSPANVMWYTFGSSLSNCYWCVYGPIPAVVIATICFFIYWSRVRDEINVSFWLYMLIIGMILSTLLMLAVAATMAEGMRITCANVSLNLGNSKGEDCNTKLDREGGGDNLPIKTSLMKDVSMAMYWASTMFFFVTTCFHIYAYHTKTFDDRSIDGSVKRF